MATTRIVIEQDVIRAMVRLLGDEALFDFDGTIAMSNDGNAGNLTIKATALARGTTGANRYDGRRVKISGAPTVAGEGPAVGGISGVTNGGWDQAEVLTVSPAFLTNPPQSEQTFMLYPRGMAPESTVASLNEVLRTTEAPHLWLPSILGDSAFEAGGTIDDGTGANSLFWVKVGTPTTSVFVTTAADILLGSSAIDVDGDAADEGVASIATPVHETESVFIWTVVKVVSGACKVELYDETNVAAIDSVTVDEPGFTEIRFQEKIPDDCEEISVRFLTTAVSDDFRVSAPVVVQPTTLRPYAAPSWLTSPEKLFDALYLPQGLVSEDADSYVALSARARGGPGLAAIRSDLDANPLHIQLAASAGGPTAIAAYRAFDEVSSDTGTTPANREYVAWKTVAKLLEGKEDRRAREWFARAASRAGVLKYNERALRIAENVVHI